MKKRTVGQWLALWVAAKLARLPFRAITRAYKKAGANGIEIEWTILAAHTQAGGNIDSLVEGMIYAKSNQLLLPFKKAAAFELVANMTHKITLTEYLLLHVKEGIRDFSKVAL